MHADTPSGAGHRKGAATSTRPAPKMFVAVIGGTQSDGADEAATPDGAAAESDGAALQ